MFVVIFEDKGAAKQAAQLNWAYASHIERTPYEEVTAALDKFS